MRVKTLTAQTSNPRKSQLSRRVSTEGSHPAFRSKVVTLQRETTMVAKPTHTLQRVWRPISYASTTVLEQTWQLEPKATDPAFRSKVVTLQRETTMVAKPTHTLQRVWRPISYASTTVLEQTWQLEPKRLEPKATE